MRKTLIRTSVRSSPRRVGLGGPGSTRIAAIYHKQEAEICHFAIFAPLIGIVSALT